MTNTSWLPRVLRWVFTVFTVFTAIGALAIAVVMLINPILPDDMTIGPLTVDFFGQQGTIAFQNANFAAIMLHGGLQLHVDNAGGLIAVLKHAGLPLAMLNVLFYGMLFDLMRRLFRNVGRGDSFTRQNVRLVQIIGFSLLIFSVVSAAAEGWFYYEIYGYLSQHATMVISGTAIRLPQAEGFSFSGGNGTPFGSPIFFTGLLVLALSEVFRQGFAIKSENDLTV